MGEVMKDIIINGKYRVDRKIGEGGFGLVYAGTDTESNDEVAIKLMLADAGPEILETESQTYNALRWRKIFAKDRPPRGRPGHHADRAYSQQGLFAPRYQARQFPHGQRQTRQYTVHYRFWLDERVLRRRAAPDSGGSLLWWHPSICPSQQSQRIRAVLGRRLRVARICVYLPCSRLAAVARAKSGGRSGEK